MRFLYRFPDNIQTVQKIGTEKDAAITSNKIWLLITQEELSFI